MPDSLIRRAKELLAPDRRTALFDVKGEVSGSTLTLRGEIHDAAMKAKLLRYVKANSNYQIVDSLIALPHPALNGRTFGVATVSVVNLRLQPDHGAEMGTQAIMGTPLRVLKKQHGWYFVQTPDRYLGWTDDMVAMMTQEEFDRWTAAPKLMVTAPFGFVRRSAGPESIPVSDVVAGALLGLQGTEGDAYKVVYPDGRTGYLERAVAEPYEEWLAHASDDPDRIIATAQRFMGVPYLWGGTSWKGLDCSGFVKTVFFLNGVLLPRDASQQARVGTDIPLTPTFDQVKPGDLFFFGAKPKNGKPERVTHVGISLGGPRFIHESGDVRVNSLDSADADYSAQRREGLLRIKRVIGAGEETGVYKLRSLPYYSRHAH